MPTYLRLLTQQCIAEMGVAFSQFTIPTSFFMLAKISFLTDERDLISAKDVLVKYLSKSELRDLFNRLGLADHTLQDCFVTAGKDDYARDMLKAWKNKKDNVLTSTDYPGGPTWENLRKALTDMGHHGAADEMENL